MELDEYDLGLIELVGGIISGLLAGYMLGLFFGLAFTDPSQIEEVYYYAG